MTDNDTIPPATGERHPAAAPSRLAAAATACLIRRNVTPNAISLASVVFAAVGALGLALCRAEVPAWLAMLLYLLAIVGIQGRLACNLLDGIVAVEGKKKGPRGNVYSDLPDRIADPILLVAAGYGVGIVTGYELGWLAAIAALLTAYVRVLGKSIGGGSHAIGPMARQHRMAVLTAGCLIAAIVGWFSLPMRRWVMYAALVVIVAGCVLTIVRRLRLIFGELDSQPAA